MTAHRKAPKDFKEYLASFPSAVQEILETIRATIKKAAPRRKKRSSMECRLSRSTATWSILLPSRATSVFFRR